MSKTFPTHYSNKPKNEKEKRPIPASAQEEVDADIKSSNDAKSSKKNTPFSREPKQRSIVPRSSVAGTALMLVVAIMAFLASLTLGAVSLVADTAHGWQSDIAREATIQVRPEEGMDMEAALTKVRTMVGATPGVTSVTLVSEDAMNRLLAPFLGSGLDLAELPVPRLITLEVNEADPPDFSTLRAQLAEAVPQASFDDHRAWVGRLATMARATIIIGVAIFFLMMVATVLTVVFATRGAMSGNAHVIEVLHFVGAEQNYIAAQFQTHFLLLGLKGAVAGGALAILTFLIGGWWTGANLADPATEQLTALFGTFAVGWTGYIGTILLVGFIGLLTAITSRFTVTRHVGTLEAGGQDG